MATPLVDPRPLNAAERAVLEHVLSAQFVGAAELRAQLDRTEVVAVWGSGSVSVDLEVREPCVHAAGAEVLVPVDAQGVVQGRLCWPVRPPGEERPPASCRRPGHSP